MNPQTILDVLPVELIAEILSCLDLHSLITVSHVSWGFRHITTNPALNPWTAPVLRTLCSSSLNRPSGTGSTYGAYEPRLRSLSIIPHIPPQTWIEILTRANASFLLLECAIPVLGEWVWKEAFARRFLPSWRVWKKSGMGWRGTFLKLLWRCWHRSQSHCTTDEAWTKYIVLNRNGTANAHDVSSRNLNPMGLFESMKIQNNLSHLPTRVRLVVELADVRILAFGTTNNPRGTFTLNSNARDFVHPPGLEPPGSQVDSVYELSLRRISSCSSAESRYFTPSTVPSYNQMTHPQPSCSHELYPFLTAAGSGRGSVSASNSDSEDSDTGTGTGADTRWVKPDDFGDLKWVGSLMIMAQIIGPRTHERDLGSTLDPTYDSGLVVGPGRSQYSSFGWDDLWAIAPWMEERVGKRIEGPGLGL